ncbi:hypothetical protein BGZ96_000218 [Linnemannia gamsii]|uniref:Uncharacterized protein n=1 Tax=Linnemannia gamsii TaxID=64522 RepID=A0ABQ7KBD9_9FUNG|nr:hypothetical protein BGZ96_000218 [Linnemannia gamsii]
MTCEEITGPDSCPGVPSWQGILPANRRSAALYGHNLIFFMAAEEDPQHIDYHMAILALGESGKGYDYKNENLGAQTAGWTQLLWKATIEVGCAVYSRNRTR